MNHWELPNQHQNHVLLANRYFYVLPEEVLEKVRRAIILPSPLPADWKFEVEMARAAKEAGSVVGFVNGHPIFDDLISSKPPLPWDINDELIEEMGWEVTATQVKSSFAIVGGHLDRFRQDRRAYAGWLTTDSEFVKQHDALCSEWNDHLIELGFPTHLGGGVHPSQLGAEQASESVSQFMLQWAEFYRHWCIQRMDGPMLPVPHGIQMPLAVAPGTDDDATYSILLPRTMPTASREDLRQMVEDARGRQLPSHLCEWADKIRPENTNPKTMERYARIFLLQHYWRILHERHAERCKLRKEPLMAQFADYFRVSGETIRQDLRLISQRLGRTAHGE